MIVADQASTPLLSGRLRSVTGPACSPRGVPFRCTVSQLMPGASVLLVIDAVTQQASPDGTRACATARVSGSEQDTRLPNNHATACITVSGEFVPVTG